MNRNPIRPTNAGKGRPKGAKNKRTLLVQEIMEANNFDPARALIECYRNAKSTYDNYDVIYAGILEARDKKQDETGQYMAPLDDKAHVYLKIAADIARELAGFVYPKLKSIEQVKSDPTQGMTATQKLEAMKQYVKVLEIQSKEEKSE